MTAERGSWKVGASYTAVVIIGLIFDLVVSWLLARQADLPLPLAGALGFVAAVFLNYVLWEKFTFSTGGFSSRRLIRTYLASLGALVIRVAILFLLMPLTLIADPILATPAKLLIASGTSFALNFFFIRRVFRT